MSDRGASGDYRCEQCGNEIIGATRFAFESVSDFSVGRYPYLIVCGACAGRSGEPKPADDKNNPISA